MKVRSRNSRQEQDTWSCLLFLLLTFILHPSKDLLERETRLELATLALARRCSTTELLPLWSTSDSNDWPILVKRARLSGSKLHFLIQS